MKNRNWLSTVFVAVAVAVASYAVSGAIYARQQGAGPGMGMGQGLLPVIGYLQLTPDQQQQVGPASDKFRADQQTACVEMRDARTRLLDVLRKPSVTKSELDAALDDVSRAQAKMQRLVAEYLLEIKPALTSDQRDRLFGLVGQKFCGQGQCGAGMCPLNGGPGRQGRCGRTP